MVGSRIVGRRITSFATSVLVMTAAIARAEPTHGPEEALDRKIAVWRFDALGIDAELVARLETLFRMELDRLDRQPLPSRRDIDRIVTGAERDCTGEEKCLVAI